MKHLMTHRMLPILAMLAIVVASFGAMATPAAAQGANSFYREAILSDGAEVTIDAQSTAAPGWSSADLFAFELACTEDSGTATLDVAIQHSFNGGETWADLTAFTQLSASGTQTIIYAESRNVGTIEATDGELSVDVTTGPQMVGNTLRVDYDVTGSGQYTCTVYVAAEG